MATRLALRLDPDVTLRDVQEWTSKAEKLGVDRNAPCVQASNGRTSLVTPVLGLTIQQLPDAPTVEGDAATAPSPPARRPSRRRRTAR